MKLPFIYGEAVDGYIPENCFYSPKEIYGVPALRSRPGLKSFCELETYGELRAIGGTSRSLYALSKNVLYKVKSNGSSREVGKISTTKGNAWIEGAGGQVMVVDGQTAYVLQNGSLSTVSASFNPTSLAYEGGHFVLSARDSKNFYETEVNDGSDVNELDYAIVTARQDNIVAVYANNGEVWAMCENSFEPYYNSGGSSFSFSKSVQGCIEEGLASSRGATVINGSMFWVSDKRTFLQSKQYAPVKISDAIIDSYLNDAVRVDDIKAFSFELGGHSFVVFCLPKDNKTFVYDSSTGLWSKWSSYPNYGRWRANCYAKCWGRHFVGDYENGKIYEIDFNTYDDDGEVFAWERTVPVQVETSDVHYWPNFVLELESGVGLNTGQGSTPQVMMQLSKDKGKTWGGERWRSFGKIGKYDNRIYWNMLGSSRNLTIKVRITDPVKRVCTGAHFK